MAVSNPERDPKLQLPFFERDGLFFFLKVLLLGALIGLRQFWPELIARLNVPERYLNAVLLFLTAHVLIIVTRQILVMYYRRRQKLRGERTHNFVLGINQIAAILSFLFFVAAVLMVFDINIREALTAISIVAAAIAILSKDYVANMINGMIIMFSDQISVGDQVEIGHHRGRIIDITLLNVHLTNDDDDLILIPNSNILSHEVINYTKRTVKKVSIEFDIAYVHLQDVAALERQLIDALGDYADHIVAGSYNLKTVKVGKDAASMKFQYIIDSDSNKEIEREIRRITVRKVIEFVAGRDKVK